eukprot:gnl/TRDRNA2_/TRDRNA2_180456_c0_seq1.p1 gnl/TRDRNA2_/TRDRNA2_180456_c0~~gnl/TRDRNA2_/TRDRNA2_180456_c0_seq1.p1  ORF type:complete len:211 (+),score=23.99 gnl/TRDRNA2_/TRDRNA2_180456_c0_seq1:74-634(+)
MQTAMFAVLVATLLATIQGARHLGRVRPVIDSESVGGSSLGKEMDVQAVELSHVLLGAVKEGRVDLAAPAPAPSPAPGPSGPPEPFMEQCLDVSRAIVMQNSGMSDKVDKHLNIICHRPLFSPDVDLCDSYRDSLVGHMHDPEYNMEKLDFELFCTGIHKVVQEHLEDKPETKLAHTGGLHDYEHP